jgi:hypothetical protein
MMLFNENQRGVKTMSQETKDLLNDIEYIKKQSFMMEILLKRITKLEETIRELSESKDLSKLKIFIKNYSQTIDFIRWDTNVKNNAARKQIFLSLKDKLTAFSVEILLSNKTLMIEEYLIKKITFLEKLLVAEEINISHIIKSLQKDNKLFVNTIKNQLMHELPKEGLIIERKCHELFTKLNIQITEPLTHKAIDNIKKNADRLSAKGETKKAELNITLADSLKQKSNDFYNKEKFEEKSTQQFFNDFQNEIESKEKELDIPRNIWKPLLLNVGIALTGIGLLAIAGKAFYSTFINKKASPFFFTHTESKAIAREARKEAETLSSFCLTPAAA